MSEPANLHLYDFDVAVSYAGEDRSYVHKFADHLRAKGVRIFYDEFYTAELWGQDLYTYLDDVYRMRSRFTVVFISSSYVAKPWPSHERQSAQARALNEMGPYLLPVRFDESLLPGLRPTVAYIDARRVTPEQLAKIVIDKLTDAPGVVPDVTTITRVPRTAAEQRELLSQRPPAWEFLYYASVLLQRRAEVEGKWRDHEIRYAPRSGRLITKQEAFNYLSSSLQNVRGITEGVNRVLDPNAQKLAFGEPGEPGNPDRIEHLATRLIGVYEEFLDWARDVRGTTVPKELVNPIELAARLADEPVEQIRRLVDDYVAEVERVPERLQRGENVYINMHLKISMDKETLAAYSKSVDEAARLIMKK
jgi:hypothetical protein